MKKLLLLILLNIFFVSAALSQFIYKIKADSVLITNDSCNAELNLENSTRNVLGFLYNKGNGRTEFRKGIIKVNDSIYIIGADTLRLTLYNSSNPWKLVGNTGTVASTNFLGTIDSVRLVFRTKNIERATIMANGNFLVGTTTDNGYKLNVEGSLRTASDAMVNSMTVGRGGGNLNLNTAVGISALAANTTGTYNTAIGNNALLSNTTGTINTAVGVGALMINTSGNYNSAYGSNALQLNTSGTANTAVGYVSLQHNTTGGLNTAIGHNSLASNTTGNYNSAIGRSALSSNTTADGNTGLGYVALTFNTTGSANTATGYLSMYTNTTGSGNTANGRQTLHFNSTGNDNVAIGSQASYNATGSANTIIGSSAFLSHTTGDNNVGIGRYAGSTLTTGSTNIFIGYNVQPNISTTGSSQLNIGNWIYGDNGKIGIGVTAPAAKLQLAAGTASANTSPLKFTSGTNLTTPESGAVEFDGTNYFATSGSTRYTLAKTLTATAALNFGSTAAQNSDDLTITVTGAADGDAVSLGVPNAAINANSSYAAWISAANTVTVRFNNYSSAAIDPASATFRVSVIKY